MREMGLNCFKNIPEKVVKSSVQLKRLHPFANACRGNIQTILPPYQFVTCLVGTVLTKQYLVRSIIRNVKLIVWKTVKRPACQFGINQSHLI